MGRIVAIFSAILKNWSFIAARHAILEGQLLVDSTIRRLIISEQV